MKGTIPVVAGVGPVVAGVGPVVAGVGPVLTNDIKNNAWVTVNNDFWVTSEAICQ